MVEPEERRETSQFRPAVGLGKSYPIFGLQFLSLYIGELYIRRGLQIMLLGV